jgi:hypothetical protein
LLSAHPSTSGDASGGPDEIARTIARNKDALKWPLVVDWNAGRVALGDVDGVKDILEGLRKSRDGEV